MSLSKKSGIEIGRGANTYWCAGFFAAKSHDQLEWLEALQSTGDANAHVIARWGQSQTNWARAGREAEARMVAQGVVMP